MKSLGSIVKNLRNICLIGVIALGLITIVGSGGGGGSSTSTTDTTSTDTTVSEVLSTLGWEMPREISAVPTSLNAVASSRNLSLRASLASLARLATDEGTDYSEAHTKKFVEEHSLKQFDIIETVLDALAQTHYADAENINNGPYKAIVAWEEEQNGIDIKQLEPWVVDSQQIEEDGEDVLRVQAWIEEVQEGEIRLVKAEMKIYSPATKNDDGSYADYGVWNMNVKFDETGEENYFAASASVGDDGESIIKIHEEFSEEGGPGPEGFAMEVKAIMNRAEAEGYGQVSYPDFEAVYGPDADPDLTSIPVKEVKYAYNESYLAVKDDDSDVQYKDRNSITEMTHRYGVYNKDTGEDVMKTKAFGFPIRYTADGITQHAYYGAWQGRHQIWGPGENASIAEGTEVTREDVPPDQTPPTYTVGKTFNGVLAKRTYVDADLNDIKNIPVEIWINQDYNLTYIDPDDPDDPDSENMTWCYCTDMYWPPPPEPPQCVGDLVDFDANVGFTSLLVGENDERKHVDIMGFEWDDQTQQGTNKNYVYKEAFTYNGDDYEDGFYEVEQADPGSPATLVTPIAKLDPQYEDELCIFIGGSIYVEYKGADTGWVEKEVVGFNTMTWTPEFSEDGDKDYTLPEGRELYINMKGSNYVVTRTGDDYETKLELQSAANPDNAATFVQAGTVFKDPWNPDGNSTYEFITEATSDNYLMLVYKTIGDNDMQAGGEESAEVGAVVTDDKWGLQAYVNDEQTDDMFNWEYQGENENWGSVTYLKDTDGSYVLLDDPMRFNSITAYNNAGEGKTLALQYDGWMEGLPMMYEELMKNDWVMSDEIWGKIINLEAGTEVTEASTSTAYLLKPLEVSQFLNLVSSDTAGLPDISQADSVDLSTVPVFVDHEMGDMPEDTVIKYSEGELVE
jgi:hypothetical protein